MKNHSGLSCEIRLIVPFHDLDPMQVVWHGNYLKYFDKARFALFHKAGIDLYEHYLQNKYLFPVIKTYTKYIYSLRYQDEFICKATLVEARIKIILDFEIRLAQSGRICATGRGEQVAIKAPEMELMLQIPDDIRKSLGF